MTKPERKPAAILYAELRNFTRMSDMLEPERVLKLANDFFALIARAAEMCSGRVMGESSFASAVPRVQPRQIMYFSV